MKKAVTAFILTLSINGLQATVLKASDLEALCQSNSEADKTTCLLIMRAYIDGFIEGVGRGVFGAYQHDSQVYMLVKNVEVKDFAPRVKRVIDLSTCGQRVTSEMMAKTFTTYVHQNSHLRSGDYRPVIYRALTEKYCAK